MKRFLSMIFIFSVVFTLSTSTCYAMNTLSDRQLSSVTSNAYGPKYYGKAPSYRQVPNYGGDPMEFARKLQREAKTLGAVERARNASNNASNPWKTDLQKELEKKRDIFKPSWQKKWGCIKSPWKIR